MNKEKHNPNFDINTKYEDIINNSKKIAELHEFVSDGSCEPPSYICLAYDVKNYLPRLIKETQELKKQLEEMDSKLFFTKNELEMRQKTIDNKLNQQKEFIEWLEAYIEDRDKVRKLHEEYSLSEERLSSQYFILQQVLSKYKEIVGYKE